MQKLLETAEQFAYSQSEKYGKPSRFQIELANAKALELAEKLHADKAVVLVGTFLMDCMLGPAYESGEYPRHIELGVRKTDEILRGFPRLSSETKENILHCIREHHGVQKFYSIESEICCNADCFKFASVTGVVGGIQNSAGMDTKKLVGLYLEKLEEKTNALSLEICKKELKPQYSVIRNFLQSYKEPVNCIKIDRR